MLHEAARAYLGVPFQHQGRSAKALDCVGLLYLSVRDCGWLELLAHDLSGYGRKPKDGLLDAGLLAAFGAPVYDLRPGDVVSMRYGREPRHVGIIGDHPHGLSLIHTDSRVGCVVEHRLDHRWLDRVAHIYRRAAE